MGTRFGCGLEQCGCCMVLIDGAPEKCCTKPAWSIAGKKIVTVEGLGSAADPHPLQQAFLDEQAGQCGYCLSGILISAKALLDKNPKPSRAEIAQAWMAISAAADRTIGSCAQLKRRRPSCARERHDECPSPRPA